jgi:hypothetical protein
MRRWVGMATSLFLVAAAIGNAVGARAAGTSSATPFTSPVKTITREHLVNGVPKTVDSRQFQLSVGDTTNLRSLQQIVVSWTGAHVTGGIAPDPNVNIAANQEYPMVLLECRGVDSGAVPADQRLDPTTCWTSQYSERYAEDRNSPLPPWRVDRFATADQRAAVFGAPAHVPSSCHTDVLAAYWVPFTASNGTVYGAGPQGCAGMAPETSQGEFATSFPSNETFAATAPDGTGTAKFDVFTADINASLGCSETVPCALVAVPVMGVSCDAVANLPPEDQAPTSTVADDAIRECQLTGSLTPGGLNLQGQTPDRAVSGSLWWAASNWRNRVTVPLSFAPVGDPCAVTGSRGGVDIYGSELMTQATAQWGPHFCSNPGLFTLKHVQTGEPQARNLLAQGNIEAAFSTYAPPAASSSIVNAPVALTGFAIAFSIDDATGHEVQSLRLTPRLLAKLLTESYPSQLNDVKARYQPLAANPLNLSADPEFVALNPNIGAVSFFGPAGAGASTLLALSSNSDIMYALSSYIVNDPEARAWLGGAPDPWGMVVNPHYNLAKPNPEIELPTNSWRLLDTFIPKGKAASSGGCTQFDVSPYLPLVAAPLATLGKIALNMEFSISSSQISCVPPTSPDPTQPSVLQPIGRQPASQHFLLGVISLGEANRFQLSTAALQTQMSAGAPPGRFTGPEGRTFVAGTDGSLLAAAKLLVPDRATQTWQIPADAIRTRPEGAGAYPGAMLVSAQVDTDPLAMSPTDASRYAQFLRFAAGEGQTPGTAPGQLPPGYLPMTEANGMGKLAAYTRTAADAVAAQSGTPPLIVPEDAAPSTSPSSSPSVLGGSESRGSSPASPTSTASGGPSSSGGPGSTIGPILGGGNQAVGGAQASVNAPVAPGKGPLAAIGRTLAVLSHLGLSILWWLLYIAAGALVGAGTLYMVARRRGVKLGLKGLIAAWKEALSSLLSRRRAPR